MFGRGMTYDGMFIRRALDAIREFMTDDGLGLIYMNFVAPAGARVRFCKALNRSVTGSMNELEMIAKYFLKTGEWSPFDVGRKLNETPLSAVACEANRYATPREAFKAQGP